MKERINELARDVEKASLETLGYATEAGADRAKVVSKASIQVNLKVEAGEFTLANTLESQGLAMVIHKDQRKASATMNHLSPVTLKQSAKDAVSLSKFSLEDKFLTMPDTKQAPKTSSIAGIFDDQVATKSLGELQELAQACLIELTKDHRVRLDRCDFSIGVSWHGLYNSLGVRQSEFQTAVSWSYFGMAVDGEEVSGFDYDGRQVYQWSRAHHSSLSDAKEFVDRVTKNLRPGRCPSYHGPVLLSPRAVEEILLGTMFYHMSGSSVMDQKSQWESKVGEKVASESLTLIDQPHRIDLAGTTSFDGDGLPTGDKTLIDTGALKLHLLDCYSANKLGKRSNAMNGGPFCLKMLPGKDSLKSMMSARNELLLIDRFSGNIDSIKGAFSGVAKSSRFLRNGQDQGAVTETMIAGNVFDLIQSIAAVSNTTEIISGAIELPWVVVDNVSVTG